MAKLTTVEKYAIQGAIGEGKNVQEIAKFINKPEKTVQNYIDTIGESVLKVEALKLALEERLAPEEITLDEKEELRLLRKKVREIEEAQKQAKIDIAQLTMGNKKIQGYVMTKDGSDRVDDNRRKVKGADFSHCTTQLKPKK